MPAKLIRNRADRAVIPCRAFSARLDWPDRTLRAKHAAQTLIPSILVTHSLHTGLEQCRQMPEAIRAMWFAQVDVTAMEKLYRFPILGKQHARPGHGGRDRKRNELKEK